MEDRVIVPMRGSTEFTPEVFIFDFDGIITNLNVDWTCARLEVEKKLGIKIDSFLDFFDSSWKTPEFSQVSLVVEGLEVEAAKICRLFDDVKPSLELLQGQRVRCYVASMQSARAVDLFLKKHELSKFFRKTITREDAGSKKRELEIVLALEAEVPRQKIVFVDDSKRHGIPCEELGMNFIHYDRRVSPKSLVEVVSNVVQQDIK